MCHSASCPATHLSPQRAWRAPGRREQLHGHERPRTAPDARSLTCLPLASKPHLHKTHLCSPSQPGRPPPQSRPTRLWTPLHHYRMDAVFVFPFSTEKVGSSESGSTSLVNVFGGHTAGSTGMWGGECPSVSVQRACPTIRAGDPCSEGDGEEECRQAGRLSSSRPFHPRPVMVPRLPPALGEGGVCVFHSQQLPANPSSFKPVSAVSLVSAHLSRPPPGLGPGRGGWGTLVQLGPGACWGRRRVDISMGGGLHLVTSPVTASPLPPRDAEIQKAFSVMFYFRKEIRHKQQGVFGGGGVVFPLQGMV